MVEAFDLELEAKGGKRAVVLLDQQPIVNLVDLPLLVAERQLSEAGLVLNADADRDAPPGVVRRSSDPQPVSGLHVGLKGLAVTGGQDNAADRGQGAIDKTAGDARVALALVDSADRDDLAVVFSVDRSAEIHGYVAP